MSDFPSAENYWKELKERYDKLRWALSDPASKEPGRFSAGELAELRSCWRNGDFQPNAAFFRALGMLHPDAPPSEMLMRQWGVILAGLGYMAAQMPGHFHDGQIKPGHALHKAGLSELRLEKWLQSDDETFLHQSGAVFRYLATKGEACNTWSLASLILQQKDSRPRHRLAGDFYYSSGKAAAEADKQTAA
ncbi:type I-E CRISPR-associated protein Cse2/CasB [Magnetofaba australis]|uniref:Putative CRISPR-associated protein, CT1973 family n=1 Tax=Magnetofaba australis IT-1 TaxID=1434232 RepID=A0A1Y2JZM4_9PROT|nr:type I-E CRISPR-associated protein Cse2/CasB [Magnetofaba australis]OSM00329.1 putative CRISPR-associated protein, CT1973 family [Magnetofaba australis IT-1]